VQETGSSIAEPNKKLTNFRLDAIAKALEFETRNEGNSPIKLYTSEISWEPVAPAQIPQ
jgi:hypothetical protein